MAKEARNKLLVLDFDHTLYDTDAFILVELKSILIEKFDLSEEIWAKSFEEASKKGYSLDKHFATLKEILGFEAISKEKIQKMHKKMRFKDYLYSDVFSFLRKARFLGYKILILSRGFSGFQDKKINGCDLASYVDEVVYTKTKGDKMQFLKNITGSSVKIIFVENNGPEVDAVKEEMPYIETYFIQRSINKKMGVDKDPYMQKRHSSDRKKQERTIFLKHNRCVNLGGVGI